MSTKKIEIYEKALETIRDYNVGDYTSRVAAKALEEAEFEGEDREVLVSKIADIATIKGLVFGSAEEIADAINAAGLTTTRGKAWSKGSVTRYMGDVRALLQKRLIENASVPVMDSAPETWAETVERSSVSAEADPVPVPENITTIAVEPVLEEVVEPAPVSPGRSVDPELAEIEELVTNL